MNISSPKIEKDWISKSGFRSLVVIMPFYNHRCGYVNVPKEHGLHKVEYDSLVDYYQVHGGITFSGELFFVDPDLYWFGYDCSHCCDKSRFNPTGVERSLSFCIDECEKLAAQLFEDTPVSLFYLWKKLGKLPEYKHNRMLAFGIENPRNEFVLQYLKS